MSESSGRSLALVIQAVAAEIHRLRALPDEATTPGDELLLVDYEGVAEELERLYEAVAAVQPGLPAFGQLVKDSG